MQFCDKTAYVWGLRYRWDPLLSRNLIPWFPHFKPPCWVWQCQMEKFVASKRFCAQGSGNITRCELIKLKTGPKTGRFPNGGGEIVCWAGQISPIFSFYFERMAFLLHACNYLKRSCVFIWPANKLLPSIPSGEGPPQIGESESFTTSRYPHLATLSLAAFHTPASSGGTTS